MAFELYSEKGGRHSAPSVTITSAGQIGLSKSCLDKYMGDRDYVQLYFDKERKLVGMKSVDKEGHNTFKITRSGGRSSGSIAGRSFLNHLEINFSKAKRFIPVWHEKEEMLVIKI